MHHAEDGGAIETSPLTARDGAAAIDTGDEPRGGPPWAEVPNPLSTELVDQGTEKLGEDGDHYLPSGVGTSPAPITKSRTKTSTSLTRPRSARLRSSRRLLGSLVEGARYSLRSQGMGATPVGESRCLLSGGCCAEVH